ncbi:NUDIX hydrolase [Nonomuraea sp. NPDC046802]|uniref:NUDIX hydrolase n=1 Tax=Nonomuraea sp. NPDC046802 TaxID=3154919 RepID=UPI0033E30200
MNEAAPHGGEAVTFTLPGKGIAVSGLFLDTRGRVLLLSRTYAAGWVLPGGIVEAGESLRAGFRREVCEELGLSRIPGRMLCLDWIPARDRPGMADRLVVVFDGGLLSAADVASIRLPEDEIGACRFASKQELDNLPDHPAYARLRACMTALADDSTLYLERGALCSDQGSVERAPCP